MKVKSSNFGVYLGAKADADTLARVGVNVETMTVNLNPTTTDYADVTMDVRQTDLESYKVTVEGTGKFDPDDPAYEVFYQFYRKQTVLDDARLPMCIVHMFDDGSNSSDMYKDTTTVVNSITLNGAAALEVSFTLSTNVSPVAGTATLTNNNKTATFTEAADS